MRSLIALIFMTYPALADTPMTAAEFDKYVTGRTLTFGTENTPTFGVEQYLPNRKVIWSTQPGLCQRGVWFDQDGEICFLYDHDPEAKCWDIFKTKSGIRGVFTTRPNTTVIFESKEAAPLICSDMLS